MIALLMLKQIKKKKTSYTTYCTCTDLLCSFSSANSCCYQPRSQSVHANLQLWHRILVSSGCLKTGAWIYKAPKIPVVVFFCSQCISASYLCYLFKVIVSFLQRTCSVQRLPHSCVFAQKGFSMIFNPVQYLPKEKNVQLPVLSRQHRATLGVRMRQLQRHCLMSAAVKHTEICQCPLWPNGRYICIDVAGKLGLLDPCYSICFKV